MMKRWFVGFICLFIFIPAIAATVYLATEKKYAFTVENLTATIPDFVTDGNKQIAVAQKWTELMDPDTGMLSIADLFAVCREGGFNTYRAEGFGDCRAFIMKLVENAEQELDVNLVSGFCPGLDEKGNNPNKLRSITDKTRVGDFCSSTNIAGGEVVFQDGYSCTCRAYACNIGYEYRGGACNTIVADGNGNCLRSEYKNVTNLPNGVLAFCKTKAVKGCKVINGINNYKGIKGYVVCNAEQSELVDAKRRIQDREDKEIAGLKYYEVCGKDKGKTGKQEYCVTDIFNWTNTQITQAIGLAQDYARLKHGKTIYCRKQDRQSGNDDYIACATKDGSVFYEFKFDDVRESIDADRRLTERGALCSLVGGKHSGTFCLEISGASCTQLNNLSRKYGHAAEMNGKHCMFTNYGSGTMDTAAFEKSLAKINGLDNRAFFNVQAISVRKNFVLQDEIKEYVRNALPSAVTVKCDPGWKTIKASDGFLQTVVGNHDDILRCYVDGKPIDFVFDDLSELGKHTRDAGEQGAKCIASNGKFDGHHCRGLTKSECFELEKKLASELKTKGWAGDGDLVDWDDAAGACELNAAQFVNNLNKTGKYVAIAGLTIGGVVTGGSTTALAVSLMAVELAGMAGEIYTERKKELLPQQWANEFLATSIVCKSASCAEETLRKNFAKMAQASGQLNRDVLNAVDDELARLAGLLPQKRLEQILSSADAPSCWDTWECQEKIFIVMQFASLAVGVGKALVKFTKVVAGKTATAATQVGTRALVTTGAHSDDAGKLLLTAGEHSDEASKLLLGAGTHVDDAERLLLTAGSHTDDMTKAVVAGGTDAENAASKFAEIASKSDDAARLANDAEKSADAAASFSNQFGKYFDDIGIKEERTAAGGFRYRDVKTGQFASRQTILERVYGKPQVAETVKTGSEDMWRAGTSARNAGTGARVATEETRLLGAGSHADDAMRSGANAANKSSDVVYNASYFKGNPSAVDDIFQQAENVVQINRKDIGADKMRDVMRSAQAHGFECSDCGGDILRFSKKADATSDAARGAGKTADNVADASKATKVTSKVDDVDDLRKGTMGANGAGGATNAAQDFISQFKNTNYRIDEAKATDFDSLIRKWGLHAADDKSVSWLAKQQEVTKRMDDVIEAFRRMNVDDLDKMRYKMSKMKIFTEEQNVAQKYINWLQQQGIQEMRGAF